MIDFRCQFVFVVAVLIAAVPTHGQDGERGALIIIENNRIRIEGDAQVRESELLPTPQQLRAVIIAPAVRELVEQLNSAEFVERELATRRLIDLRTDDVQFFAVLERGDLAAEQRHRLLHIVRERLTNTPRGALGIRMDAGQVARPPGQAPEQNAKPGVTILEVIAGMPAERVLRVGDRISHIDRKPIATSEDLIEKVQTRRPGEVLILTVHRPQRDEAGLLVQDAQGAAIQQQIELEITLGTVEDLHDPRIPAPPSRLDIERRRIVAAIEQRYGSPIRELEVIRR